MCDQCFCSFFFGLVHLIWLFSHRISNNTLSFLVILFIFFINCNSPSLPVQTSVWVYINVCTWEPKPKKQKLKVVRLAFSRRCPLLHVDCMAVDELWMVWTNSSVQNHVPSSRKHHECNFAMWISISLKIYARKCAHTHTPIGMEATDQECG